MQLNKETVVGLGLPLLLFGIPVAVVLVITGTGCFELVMSFFCSGFVAVLCHEMLSEPADGLSKTRFYTALILYLTLLVFLTAYCAMFLQDIERAFSLSVSAALFFMTFVCWPILLWKDQSTRATIYDNKKSILQSIVIAPVVWVVVTHGIPLGLSFMIVFDALTGFCFGVSMHFYAYFS